MSGADAMSGAMEGERLAAELSALRERTGLSLVGLAERTPYSKSSWQRYLNGTQPLPRHAVEALCALAGEPPGRLLVLWELADAAWSGRAGTRGTTDATDATDTTGVTGAAGATGTTGATGAAASSGSTAVRPPDGPSGGRRRRVLALALVAVVTVAVTAVLLGAGLLRGGDDGRRQNAADATWIQVSPLVPGCTGSACDGKNPAALHCGGQGMVATVHAFTARGGQRLELRYGEHCRAVWVRASRLLLGDRVVLTVPGAEAAELVAIQRDVGRYVSTPMAGAGDPADARICLRPGAGRSGSEECFGDPEQR
ncbi:helix-turn-helix domain-containing protein [Streptomyces sp. NPDC002018]|uniref:helix-turn-helix domain-containing protein n=1 Tax=Streptomyces sp. NPDC002018 TaxID=3364629 RepID=UPI0036CEF731